MKCLPKETCEYLVSLGCTSESGEFYAGGTLVCFTGENYPENSPKTPAFSLEDILRKENVEKIQAHVHNALTAGERWQFAERVALLVYNDFDTWPEQVSKLILPDGRP